MVRLSLRFAVLVGTFAIVSATSTSSLLAQHSNNQSGDRRPWPGYQRRAFDWRDGDKHNHRHGRQRNTWISPRVESGWFQRPYPYHLDYYKMRYHGSYEPYFGNLYGPPEVVTAPPYYGPYYGGSGLGAGGYQSEYGAYPNSEFGGGPIAYPVEPQMQSSAAAANSAAAAQPPTATTKDENLPAPAAE